MRKNSRTNNKEPIVLTTDRPMTSPATGCGGWEPGRLIAYLLLINVCPKKRGRDPSGLPLRPVLTQPPKGPVPFFWALLSGRITGRHRDSGKRWPTPGRAVLQRELPLPCAKPEVGSPERRL